jgi:hypothetical protein
MTDNPGITVLFQALFYGCATGFIIGGVIRAILAFGRR